MVELEWRQVFLVLNKLVLAAFMGGAIGVEREVHGQAAGFRTNLLVCLGGCIIMMLSLHMETLFRHLSEDSVVRLDPGRIASYAVAGMGFLGAGAIIKGRGSVRGLTTASSLWLVNGIGLAVGAGFVIPAFLTTLISLIILFGLRRFKFYFSHDVYSVLTLNFNDNAGHLHDIRDLLSEYPEVEIRSFAYDRNILHGTVAYRLRLCNKQDIPWSEIAGRMSRIPGLERIVWEEGGVP